jgi:hypothetical protein
MQRLYKDMTIQSSISPISLKEMEINKDRFERKINENQPLCILGNHL